jgi:hypothetical protein
MFYLRVRLEDLRNATHWRDWNRIVFWVGKTQSGERFTSEFMPSARF